MATTATVRVSLSEADRERIAAAVRAAEQAGDVYARQLHDVLEVVYDHGDADLWRRCVEAEMRHHG